MRFELLKDVFFVKFSRCKNINSVLRQFWKANNSSFVDVAILASTARPRCTWLVSGPRATRFSRSLTTWLKETRALGTRMPIGRTSHMRSSKSIVISNWTAHQTAISYPESSGSLVSGLVAGRDSGEMEFFPLKSGDPVIVRMLSFIKTEVNVSREVGMLDESLDGNQKS